LLYVSSVWGKNAKIVVTFDKGTGGPVTGLTPAAPMIMRTIDP
jgi:hypothetical protein